jgi:hypothetical protein
MLFEFPTEDDWQKLVATFPFHELRVRVEDIRMPDNVGDDVDGIYARLELPNWIRHLQHRIVEMCQSYVMLMFYYNLGIPDENWEAKEENGEPGRYFSNFEDRHFQILEQFAFYTDVFYYKLFSALDTIGQVLVVTYQLELRAKKNRVDEKVDFRKAVNALKETNPVLYRNLSEIMSDPDYETARTLRNDITHNFKPTALGSNVKRFSDAMAKGVSFGGHNYTPSSVFKENILRSLNLLLVILRHIKEQSK